MPEARSALAGTLGRGPTRIFPTLLRSAVAPALLLGLSACAVPWDPDHPDRMDRVTLGAGDAQQRNIHIHAVDPIPPKHPLPDATYDGQRVMAVLDLFYDRVGVPPQGAMGAPIGAGGS